MNPASTPAVSKPRIVCGGSGPGGNWWVRLPAPDLARGYRWIYAASWREAVETVRAWWERSP